MVIEVVGAGEIGMEGVEEIGVAEEGMIENESTFKSCAFHFKCLCNNNSANKCTNCRSCNVCGKDYKKAWKSRARKAKPLLMGEKGAIQKLIYIRVIVWFLSVNNICVCCAGVKLFKKSNLHYTRRITPKRVTSCGAHFRGLAPGQHSSEETSQRWRVVGDTVSI